MISSALVMLLLAAEPAALERARGHLKTGELEEVIFDLKGQSFSDPKHRKGAADVLAQSAARMLNANDDLMALQLAQMALTHDTAHAAANEIAARTSLKQQQFGDAEKYGDAWVTAANSNAARLFRAELAVDQGDWGVALAVLEGGNFAGAELDRASKVRAKAKLELGEREGALSEARAMEEAMKKAAAQARELPPPAAQAKSGEIVIYTASWCGYCTRLRSWLNQQRIPFVERDVEKAIGAADELIQKQSKQNVPPNARGGVPWTDVRGVLVRGYDVPKIEEALRR